MAFEILNHRRRWIARARSVGAPRIVAAVLLLATAVVLLAVVRPGLEELASRQTRSVAASLLATQPDAIEARREEFLRAFPRLEHAPEAMRMIVRAARETNVELARGDYRLVPGREGEGFSRYEISLPVVATYPQARLFMARVLADLPFAAIDGVAFERSKTADALVNVRIDITLFLRREPS